MKTLSYYYENLTPLTNLLKYVNKDDILYFDIETTGLSRKNNHIYLIGCGYYSDGGLNIIQWFAENEQEEVKILKEFASFASSFLCLVNYNGQTFDIPFTTTRMEKYGLKMPSLDSLDIYTLVKPLKRILSLSDITQKSIEQFLGIKRDDKFNGGELISVYKKYTHSPSEDALHNLLLHNKEDVLNMHYLTDILDYTVIFDSMITYSDHEIKEYVDYNGCKKTELIINGTHKQSSLPHGFNTFKNEGNGSYIMNFRNDGTLSIRVPVINDTLYYYLDNYKDYYYLPIEDMCILKSMGGGVLKENRVNCTKETCRIKHDSQFIPFIQSKNDASCDVKLFRGTYKSKENFVRLVDFENFEINYKNIYVNHLFKFFI